MRKLVIFLFPFFLLVSTYGANDGTPHQEERALFAELTEHIDQNYDSPIKQCACFCFCPWLYLPYCLHKISNRCHIPLPHLLGTLLVAAFVLLLGRLFYETT